MIAFNFHDLSLKLPHPRTKYTERELSEEVGGYLTLAGDKNNYHFYGIFFLTFKSNSSCHAVFQEPCEPGSMVYFIDEKTKAQGILVTCLHSCSQGGAGSSPNPAACFLDFTNTRRDRAM